MRNRPRRVSNGVAGLIVAAATACILAVVLFPIIHESLVWPAKRNQLICMGSCKQIMIGIQMYAQDWDEKPPPADRWAEATNVFVKNEQLWHCPAAIAPFSYASNKALQCLPISQVAKPETTVYLFENDASDWNTVRGIENLVVPQRHNGTSNYGFLDGHVRAIRGTAAFTDFTWKPRLLPPPPKPAANKSQP